MIKKAFTLLMILQISCIANAQHGLADYTTENCDIIWFGVDFTLAKLIGVDDFNRTKLTQKELLESWNAVILKEPKKYNLPKFFRLTRLKIDLSEVLYRNSKIDFKNLVIDSDYSISESDALDLLDNIDLKQYKDGIGLILIIESFHKRHRVSTGYLAIFDISSRKPFFLHRLRGGSNGIGIESYWSNAIYDMLQSSEKLIKTEIKRK
ncbi:hypothetical protein ACFLR1_01630 [Bacteroidota bacterium]